MEENFSSNDYGESGGSKPVIVKIKYKKQVMNEFKEWRKTVADELQKRVAYYWR